ncbi:MAG: carbonic anhydrase [Myxococcales bacterium]|nr:carbonic anhydrase [Myxococcales bacterium]
MATKTYQSLVEGVRHFETRVAPLMRERLAELGSGQAPSTLFVTCSDSRVSPNLITQTGPGDLFVLRNAGNLVPVHGAGEDSSDSAVEYAVSALGVSQIVVCGHLGCGAMAALMDPASTESLAAVRRWLLRAEGTRQAVLELPAADRSPARIVERNVHAQLQNLLTHPCVQDALEAGTLSLHGWIYDVGTGQVQVLDVSIDAPVRTLALAEAHSGVGLGAGSSLGAQAR